MNSGNAKNGYAPEEYRKKARSGWRGYGKSLVLWAAVGGEEAYGTALRAVTSELGCAAAQQMELTQSYAPG